MNSLKDFIRVIKLNEIKKQKLLERIKWIDSCMCSCPSPTYDRIGGSTNVKPDRIMILLEKKDKVRRSLKRIENQRAILAAFVKNLTSKEQLVFQEVLWEGSKARIVAKNLNVSITRVYEITRNIDHKWSISLNT